jgi:hypothetical protein
MWKCIGILENSDPIWQLKIMENSDPIWQLKIKMYRRRQSISTVKFDDVIMRHVNCLYRI